MVIRLNILAASICLALGVLSGGSVLAAEPGAPPASNGVIATPPRGYQPATPTAGNDSTDAGSAAGVVGSDSQIQFVQLAPSSGTGPPVSPPPPVTFTVSPVTWKCTLGQGPAPMPGSTGPYWLSGSGLAFGFWNAGSPPATLSNAKSGGGQVTQSVALPHSMQENLWIGQQGSHTPGGSVSFNLTTSTGVVGAIALQTPSYNNPSNASASSTGQQTFTIGGGTFTVTITATHGTPEANTLTCGISVTVASP